MLSSPTSIGAASGFTDVDILNFALNLEVCIACKNVFLMSVYQPVLAGFAHKFFVISACLDLLTLFTCSFQCLEAEFYSWVAYGEGIYTVNSTLVGRLKALQSQLCLPVHAMLNAIWQALGLLSATNCLSMSQWCELSFL